MNPSAAVPLSRNGRLLARVTGWRWRRVTVSPSLGPEACYHLPGADLLAVMRPSAARRCVVYGPPDALGRRQTLAQTVALCDGIRWALDYVAQRQAEHVAKLDRDGEVC